VLTTDEVPALLALNHDLRTEYVKDCQSGMKRWNRVLEQAGIDRRWRCRTSASTAGRIFSDHQIHAGGEVVGADSWQAKESSWLPTEADKAHVRSLMPRCTSRARSR